MLMKNGIDLLQAEPMLVFPRRAVLPLVEGGRGDLDLYPVEGDSELVRLREDTSGLQVGRVG